MIVRFVLPERTLSIVGIVTCGTFFLLTTLEAVPDPWFRGPKDKNRLTFLVCLTADTPLTFILGDWLFTMSSPEASRIGVPFFCLLLSVPEKFCLKIICVGIFGIFVRELLERLSL